MTLTISADEYNKFRQILEDSSGIMLGEGKEYLVTSRFAAADGTGILAGFFGSDEKDDNRPEVAGIGC